MNQSVQNSIQKANSKPQSNLNSMKSFTEGDYSPYQRTLPSNSSPYLTNSPKNINDKIDFINQLYDQLNETKSYKQNRNEYDKPNRNDKQNRNEYLDLNGSNNQLLKASGIISANRSTDTPEQLQPVQPMQLDENETVHYSKLWTFHNNSREQSQDRISQNRTQDIRAQDIRAQDIRAQDIRAQDLRTQDIRAQDLRTQDIRTQDVRAFEQHNYKHEVESSFIINETLDKTLDNPFIKDLEERWNQSTYQIKAPYKPHDRELMINQLFDDLNGGKTSKSSKRKTNYVEQNKKPENLKCKPQYEKMLESIDRRINSKTPLQQKRPYQAPLTKLSNTAQKRQLSGMLHVTPPPPPPTQQALKQQDPNVSHMQPRPQRQDYKKFLEEINMLGEKLCKTSGSLNRTMNEIKKREKPRNRF